MDAEHGALVLLAYLVTYAIHSTVLLGLAALITRRPDTGALRLRERVWKIAVLGGFATALLQTSLGIEPPLGRLALRTSIAQDAAPPSAEGARAHEPARSDELAAFFADDSPFLRAWPAPGAGAGDADPAAGPAARPASSTGELSWPAAIGLVAAHAVERSLPSVASDAGANPSRELADLGTGDAAPSDFVAAGATGAGPRVDAELPGTWTSAAVFGWSLSGLAGALLFLLGLRRLRRELAGRVELHEGAAHARLAALVRRAGLDRRVRLFVAPRLAAPLSMGWRRPAICVPPRALTDLPPDELEAMLAHELAHLARRDPPWLFLLWLVQTVFFFQPLNRRARRELADTFELAADAWAARATGERLALASCLARIAGWVVGERAPRMDRAWSAAMADSLDARRPRSRLGARIEHLLDERACDEPTRARRAEAALAVGVLGALALVVPGASAAAPVEARELPDEREPLERLVEHAASLPAARPPAETPAETPVETPVVVEPAPPSAVPPAAPPPSSISTELFADLDADLDGLEAEIAALGAELAASAPDAQLEQVLEDLWGRAQRMRERRTRIQALLEVALAAEARLAAEPGANDDDGPDSEKGRGE